jgi:orotate phosphoribosyltransferase
MTFFIIASFFFSEPCKTGTFRRLYSNPGKREDSRDKYLHEIRFKKTRNEFLRYKHTLCTTMNNLYQTKQFIMNDRQRLKKILLEKSYRQGSFTLTSGLTSDFYIDGKQTTLSAEGAYLCGKLILELILKQKEPIQAVGGMTLGADPLVTAVSLVSFLEKKPIPAFIVRKEAKGHGTGNYIEGLKNMPAGCRVALLEDVVTTGGTLLKVIERVEAQGFKVGVVITVVERQEGGVKTLADAGYNLESIFTREELLS